MIWFGDKLQCSLNFIEISIKERKRIKRREATYACCLRKKRNEIWQKKGKKKKAWNTNWYMKGISSNPRQLRVSYLSGYRVSPPSSCCLPVLFFWSWNLRWNIMIFLISHFCEFEEKSYETVRYWFDLVAGKGIKSRVKS